MPGILASLWRRVGRWNAGTMVLLAAFVGLLGGYGAVGFRWLIEFLHNALWKHSSTPNAFWVVAIPATGGLVSGLLTHRFAPEARGHGVPEVMEAAVKGGVIRPRVVGAKALASGACIAAGGSVGREGPIVQIGAAIGSTVGQLLSVGARRLRTLVGCGAASGVAATFNAPIAGALFAVEILLGDFAVHQFSPIVVAAVVATVVSRYHLSDVPAFEIPADQLATYRLEHPAELLFYAGLGLLAGGVAFLLIKALSFAEERFEGSRLPLPMRAGLGGATVGLIALVFPQVLGVGYETVTEVLVGSPSVTLLAGLIFAKILATSITLGSGGSGGVFAPSLFIGSMLGGVVGHAVNYAFPDVAAVPNAYALVGMGAVVAAATRAPITTILVIFELTSDYRIMLPLMLTCIVSTLFSQRLGRDSIYTEKLSRRGIHIRAGQDINILRNIPVREVLRPSVRVIDPGTHLKALVARLTTEDGMTLYVTDAEDRVVGVISMPELRTVLGNLDDLDDLIVAADVAEPEFPGVSIDDTLEKVLQRLDAGYRDELPVLDEARRLMGVVRLSDVLARYRNELAKREIEEEPVT